jgi:hypothetical protein
MHEKNIPMDKMKVVLLQLMQADEYYTRMSTIDTSWKIHKKNVQFYKQIFELNKVDRVDFYNTIGYLQKHPVDFKELMDSTNALSKREKLNLSVH